MKIYIYIDWKLNIISIYQSNTIFKQEHPVPIRSCSFSSIVATVVIHCTPPKTRSQKNTTSDFRKRTPQPRSSRVATACCSCLAVQPTLAVHSLSPWTARHNPQNINSKNKIQQMDPVPQSNEINHIEIQGPSSFILSILLIESFDANIHISSIDKMIESYIYLDRKLNIYI